MTSIRFCWWSNPVYAYLEYFFSYYKRIAVTRLKRQWCRHALIFSCRSGLSLEYYVIKWHISKGVIFLVTLKILNWSLIFCLIVCWFGNSGHPYQAVNFFIYVFYVQISGVTIGCLFLISNCVILQHSCSVLRIKGAIRTSKPQDFHGLMSKNIWTFTYLKEGIYFWKKVI